MSWNDEPAVVLDENEDPVGEAYKEYGGDVNWNDVRQSGLPMETVAAEYFEAGWDAAMKHTEDESWVNRRVSENIRYVNVYLVHRAYGGSEEGGWYYDAGELIETRTACNEEDAKAILLLMETDYDANKRRYHYEGSWAVARIEDRPGQDYPVRRPRYE